MILMIYFSDNLIFLSILFLPLYSLPVFLITLISLLLYSYPFSLCLFSSSPHLFLHILQAVYHIFVYLAYLHYLSGCLYGNKKISVNLAEKVFTSAIQNLRKILGSENNENEEKNTVTEKDENHARKNRFLIPEQNMKKGKSVNEINFFQLTAGSQGKTGKHVRTRTYFTHALCNISIFFSF